MPIGVPRIEVALGCEDATRFVSNLQHNRARSLWVECDLMRRYRGQVSIRAAPIPDLAARITRTYKLRQQPVDPGSLNCSGFLFVAIKTIFCR